MRIQFLLTLYFKMVQYNHIYNNHIINKYKNIYTTDVSELEVFNNISKFSFQDFKFKWNLLLFLTDTYNLFTSIYCLAFVTYPSEFWLEFELLFEGILL